MRRVVLTLLAFVALARGWTPSVLSMSADPPTDRRGWLGRAATVSGFTVSGLAAPASAAFEGMAQFVVRPETTASVQGTQAFQKFSPRQLELQRRPAPPTGARPRLEQDFAVLMMRSSYGVADDLDFVSMAEFQRRFFLFRQQEYEDYLRSLDGASVMQGDLTDARYFDFISFAQYCTISACMRQPQSSFKEKVGAEGEELQVDRDSSITDAMLPTEHSRRVGDQLLTWMTERYNTNKTTALTFAAARAGGDPVTLTQDMLSLFQINNFCKGFEVIRGAIDELEVKVVRPANRWSLEVLQNQQRTLVVNNFEIMAVLAYLRACGFDATVAHKSRFKGDDVTHFLSLKQA